MCIQANGARSIPPLSVSTNISCFFRSGGKGGSVRFNGRKKRGVGAPGPLSVSMNFRRFLEWRKGSGCTSVF